MVQDTTPVAEPTAPAMGEGRVLDMLAQDGGVLRRLSNVTPKKCEKLASGFLHRGEITLLCGDGGVGKGQFVAQIAKSLTTGEPTEFFPQAPEGTGNIVILAGEDPIDTVLCPRMDAAGADLNKVAVIAPDTYYEEIYTLPSDLEGMPLSLLEAMSYGNCCLVSDIPECAEVVEDKALIFKKSDVEDLREKLQDACDHPEMVIRMKNQAADFICEKYNWDKVVKETMKLYRK